MTRQRAETVAERKQRRAAVTNPEIVMEAAAAFLAVRPRSVAETRTRLAFLGYGQELVEQVVERLLSIGYLDDEAFARAWVESRDRARPRGGHALGLELMRKGIDRQTIDLVIAERAVSVGDAPRTTGTDRSPDLRAAERLLERRTSTLERETDPRKRRAKAYALLARNGFDPEVCTSVAAAWATGVKEAGASDRASATLEE